MQKTAEFHPTPTKHYLRGIIIAVLLSVLTFPISFYIPEAYIILLVGIWVITVMQLISITFQKQFITITLEVNSVSISSGMMSKKLIVTPYDKILLVNLNRGVFDRICGVATIEITTSGDTPEIVVDDIPINYANEIVEHTKIKD